MASATTDRRLGLAGNTAYKVPATVLATANITLSGEQTIDGIAVKAVNTAGVPDRVLCTGETNAAQNGLWDVSTAAWTRSIDANGNYDLAQGTQVIIARGSAAFQVWTLTTANPITVDTTSQSWSQSLTSGSLATLAAAGGSALFGFIQAGTGAVASTGQAKNRESFSVFDFLTDAQRADVRAKTAAIDCTAAVQAALSAAYVANIGAVEVMEGITRIDGTLTVPSGVTLFANSATSEYYPGSPYNSAPGGQLYKPNATGTAGPIVILDTASGIRGLYLRHSKVNGATTGIVRVGTAGISTLHANIKDCRIYGSATADITGVNTCVGIYFPDGSVASTYQRYFNVFNNFDVTNCDWGIRLGENCNANVFSNFIIRQTYWDLVLDGVGAGRGCVENVFNGFTLQNIGALPTTQPVGFTLKNYATGNIFSNYTTELSNGATYSIDATSSNASSPNRFDGLTNDVVPSYVPAGNIDSRYQAVVNRDQVAQMLLPNSTTGTRNTNGQGNAVSLFGLVSGTLPTVNRNAGTMNPADASVKRIATFNSSVYAKAQRPCFYADLQVFLNSSGGGAGECIAHVRFMYRVTDNATNAASLSVLATETKGNLISGLYFLTGVAAASGFGLALVGGNGGAVSATHIAVLLNVAAVTHDTNSVAMASYADITFVSAATTANDSTDAISLLTVADTAV